MGFSERQESLELFEVSRLPYSSAVAPYLHALLMLTCFEGTQFEEGANKQAKEEEGYVLRERVRGQSKLQVC